MKRGGYIKRKTPMKRGPWTKVSQKPGTLGAALNNLQRKGPIKKRAPKYPDAKTLKERTAWLKQWDRCFLCGKVGDLDTHEIIRRSQAPYRWASVSNYLAVGEPLVCNCHAERLANITVAPYAFQLAVKYLCDPQGFDFLAWCEVLGVPGKCPTMSEVEEMADRLRGEKVFQLR